MAKGRYPDTTDEQLVLGALLGDLRSFDELIRRFRGAAVAVANQVLGSREAAEDVAQEAFLLAFKALPQLAESAKFGGWLCAIVRHRARRVAARDSRYEATEPTELDRLILENSEELRADPEAELARRETRREIAEAIACVPDDYALVLRLRYLEQWPVARIADFLSLPLSTVKWRLHAGREMLRRRLIQSSYCK
jgi:RNA polymerase sigma-70 factor (ECF subfamily)